MIESLTKTTFFLQTAILIICFPNALSAQDSSQQNGILVFEGQRHAPKPFSNIIRVMHPNVFHKGINFIYVEVEYNSKEYHYQKIGRCALRVRLYENWDITDIQITQPDKMQMRIDEDLSGYFQAIQKNVPRLGLDEGYQWIYSITDGDVDVDNKNSINNKVLISLSILIPHGVDRSKTYNLKYSFSLRGPKLTTEANSIEVPNIKVQ